MGKKDERRKIHLAGLGGGGGEQQGKAEGSESVSGRGTVSKDRIRKKLVERMGGERGHARSAEGHAQHRGTPRADYIKVKIKNAFA